LALPPEAPSATLTVYAHMFDKARQASRAHQSADLHSIQVQIDDQVAGKGMAEIVRRQPGVIDAQASGVGGGMQRGSLEVCAGSW
jgi:hypothetical protein